MEWIPEVLISVAGLGWVGKTIYDLMRTRSQNAKDEADAHDVGVGSLLRIIATLEERVLALEKENAELRPFRNAVEALDAQNKLLEAENNILKKRLRKYEEVD